MDGDHALAITHAEDCGRAAVFAIGRCAEAGGGPGAEAGFRIWRAAAVYHARQAWRYACLAVAIEAEAARMANDSGQFPR